MSKNSIFLGVFLVFISTFSAQAQETPSVENTRLYFIAPNDGDVINGPITVRFGLAGMGVAPAGIEKAGTGHHHLIIDAPLPPFDENIPLDENHMHFGGGHTEVTISLAPGKHTLQLLLGDQNHLPHLPPVFSKIINITVTE
ncbi:DUF4399 domain-containing protein [Kordiimonas aquimaris]|uniref:DUF4399 domain-containing protein n=1 Tax=Kordiimonas aquimaris TaxID=707591 RepID=UPI0021D008B5|nr:DUF4399 domain-containing protein [Kordiimonas aquimaris]